MGFFSNESKRIFIARNDEARNDIIYRYPEKNVRTMTQLTCQPDECAVFVKNGQIVGTLGPGTHTLETNNVPFLSALLEKATGGNLFIAEIYFVSTREVPSVKFGGPLGSITDNVTQMMCDARVFGEFSIQVTDPQKLIFGSVGSGTALQSNNAFLDWFKQILMKFMSDAFGELSNLGWSLNKMISPANKLELSEAVLKQVEPEISQYGLKIVRFGNFNLSISEQDKQKLNELNVSIADDQRRMQMVNDPNYARMAQIEMMRGAGKGMAKGGDGAGAAMAGMGMSMGMGMMNNMMAQQSSMVAPVQNTDVICPTCNQRSAPGKFCNQCGSSLSAPAIKCECGEEVPKGAKFCGNCGKSFAKPKCECGAELAMGAKFCNSCGKKV